MRTTLSLLATTILIGLTTPALAAESPRPLAAGDTLIGGRFGFITGTGTTADSKWALLEGSHLVTDGISVGAHLGRNWGDYSLSYDAAIQVAAYVELSPRFYFVPHLEVGARRFTDNDTFIARQARAGVGLGVLALLSEHLYARLDVGGAEIVRAWGDEGAGTYASGALNPGGVGFVMLGSNITVGLRL